MIRIRPALFAICLAAGSAALAHEGVQNPAVKARMDAMGIIGQNMKILGGMAKGEIGFDAAAANAALSNIAAKSAEIPILFEAEEDDPKSEAAEEIWLDWEGFITKAQALQAAAKASTGITDPAGLGAAMGQVAPACKSCHEAYKF